MPSLVFNQQTDVQPGLTPADARGAQFTPAVGEAFQHLGSEGGRLAGDFARIDYMQKNADAAAAVNSGVVDGMMQLGKYAEDLKGQMPENGAGYTQKVMDAVGNWTKQFVGQQTTPVGERMASARAKTMMLDFFNRSTAWESDTRRAWRTSAIDDSITKGAALVSQDPSVFGPLLQDTQDGIKAAMSDLHPQQARLLQEKAQGAFSEAAALSYAQTHPQDTMNAIYKTQPQPQGSIPAKIVSAAKGAGVDPHSALAITQFESGMDPNAQNPSSTAHGLFQMLSSTGDQYYPQGADRTNPDAQIQAGVKFLADNTKAFRNTVGRDPTTPELYSMHLLGLGGGMALAKADPSEPFAELAAKIDSKHAAAIVANNGFQGLTVGQVRDKIGGWMQDASNKTYGMANAPAPGEQGETPPNLPWLRNLTPQGRQAIFTHAQNITRKDDTTARYMFDQRMNNAIAQMQNGIMPKDIPTMDDAVKAFPMQVAADKIAKLQGWQNYGAAYSKLALESPQEQQQTLAAMKPSANDPDYANKFQMYAHADNAMQQINQARAKDYLQYDMSAGTKVAQPLDFSSQQFLSGPLASRFAQSSQLSSRYGLPFRAFTDQEAYGLGQFLQKANPTDALSYLDQVKQSSDSPQHFVAAMGQIAKNQPALAAAAMLPPQVGVKVIEGERLANPASGKTAIPLPSMADVKVAWDKLRGQAYQGLPQTSAVDMHAALDYYVATRAPGTEPIKGMLGSDPTFKAAVQAVAPVAESYNGRDVVLPHGVDAGQFPDLVASRWDASFQAAGLDPAKHPRGAYQLLATDEPGVYMPVSGTTALPVKIDINPQHTMPFPNAAPRQPAAPPQTPDVTALPLKGRRITKADLNRGFGRSR